LIDSTFATSNVNTICAINDGNIQYYCNQTIYELNDTYGSLKTMYTRGGAPYTNDYQVTQNDPTKPTLWAASIEDFNEDAGANCSDPQIMTSSPCGPTYGNFNMTLTHTTFKYTSGWEFANVNDLKRLINLDSAYSYSSVGSYLEEKAGFKNMTNTSRIVQANASVSIQLRHSRHKFDAIPFFYADWPVFLHGGSGPKWAVYEVGNDFTDVLEETYLQSTWCSPFIEGYIYTYAWVKNSSYGYNDNLPYARDEWFTGYATGSSCDPDEPMGYFFYWTEEYGSTDNNAMPGWVAERQKNPGGAIKPAYAFLWPIKRLPSTLCTDSRSSTNKGGMPTMCGDDFTAWLNNILPPPPGQ